MGERRGTKGLELWCRKMTEGYPGVKIENMTTSWRDGLAFCAIIHHFRPDLIDFSKLNKEDVYRNNELAFTIAEQHLGIPALLEPEDMVEFPVPDRLSILTYLSQFYQTFAVSQGSPSRIVPKRSTTTSERGIVSPASTSPPTKILARTDSVRRESCAKCNQSVFIAERLNVGKQLFHRTCFRCARCNSQLTLANYYETENSDYCCETCPDEELRRGDVGDSIAHQEKLLFSRSLSDEEKSASLKGLEKEDDDYSAMFETALENADDQHLKKSYTLEHSSSDFSQARSKFIHSDPQIERSSSDSDSGNEEDRKSPEKNHSESLVKNCDDNDSGFPTNKQYVNSVSDDSANNQLQTASVQLGKTHNFVVTKETLQSDQTSTSLVKVRTRLFEGKNLPPDEGRDNVISKNQMTSSIKSLDVSVEIKENPVEHSASQEQLEASHITITDSSSSINENKIDTTHSVIIISDSSAETKRDDDDYPEDLNPFADDDDESEKRHLVKNQLDYSPDLNSFASDEDEITKPSPKPRAKKKVKPLDESHLNLFITRESYNPFEEDEEESQIQLDEKRLLIAPKISLNPFWKEDEEDDSPKEKPVPLPRVFVSATSQINPKQSTGAFSSMNSSHSGSNTSLSNIGTTSTIKKKKPAPPPPESPGSSITSSPAHSAHPSPKHTLRIRKTKKAPLPPSSTPYEIKKPSDTSIDISPITTEPIQERHDDVVEWENEKSAKDEMNRNRQSVGHQHQPGTSQLDSDASSSKSTSYGGISQPNKSTYGKWKKRKGPAPSRPVPQRRIIKALPMGEIRRELEVIEIQQQGLERQGVRLEQNIRERCEGSNYSETDSSASAQVEDMILQLFELVNEKNELFRKQAELMYLRRQQRLEEEHADVEYQIRCLMLQPEASKTDCDKAREEELISRLLDIVERRNEIIECLEMDRVREAEEDDSINSHLNMYTLKRDEKMVPALREKPSKKDKKKHKNEKKLKSKGQKIDIDKDVDECESSSSSISPVKGKEKKKKKFNLF